MNARLAILLVLLACVLAARTAAADDPDRRAEAQRHFKLGLDRVDRKAWDEALEEFLRSRAIVPTKSALKNAAACLRELRRYDEALDMYEDLQRSFAADLTPAERKVVDDDTTALARFVGAVAVESEIAGATVLVDERERGTTPLARPVRVTVGTRAVRVVKAGFAPYETRVRVASGETSAVRATLTAVAQRGRLRVREAKGGALEVRVDAAVVGSTPWEGDVSTGQHVVSLHGARDVGAPPRAVEVRTDDVTDVTLEAAPLLGEVRVETTPTDARVRIDGAEVSRGTWTGRIPSGPHVLDVTLDWFEPHRATIDVTSTEPRVSRVALERVRRVYAEMFGGVVPALFHACSGSCTGNLIGMRGGYAVTPRIGVEVAFVPGFAVAHGSTAYDASPGLAVGAASVRYQFFDRTPLTLRFWAGLARGFTDAYFLTPIVGPEARIGYRFDANAMIDAGLAMLLFSIPTPTNGPSSSNSGLAVTMPFTIALRVDL